MGGEQAAGVLAQVKRSALEARGQGDDWSVSLPWSSSLPWSAPRLCHLIHVIAVQAQEEAAFRAEHEAKYDHEGSPLYASARLWDDGVIRPEDTRKVLSMALAVAQHNPAGPTEFGVFRM